MQLNYRSEFNSQTDVTVVLPTDNLTIFESQPPAPVSSSGRQRPAGPPKHLYKPGMKFQTIWLLHGGGDDDQTTYRMTSLERYAQENNVMLVTACVRGSMYVNSVSGNRALDYLVKELPLVIRTLFPSSDKREDNFVVGSAMGGNGALGLGILHPEMYSAVVDLSGGIGLTLDRQNYMDQMEWGTASLGNTLRGAKEFKNTDHDLYYLAQQDLMQGLGLPEIFLAVGEKDFIRYRVKADYEALRELGCPVYYEEAKGLAHEWDFWDLYLRKAIYEWLPLKRKPIYEEL